MNEIRLTASDKSRLVELNVAYEILAKAENSYIQRRMEEIEGASEDIALIKDKIRRIMKAIPLTIPPEQRNNYIHSLEMACYTVGFKRPGGMDNTKEWGLWISYDALNALLDGCHDHCMMCPSDKAERRACTLRRALETLPNDAAGQDLDDCPYYAYM